METDEENVGAPRSFFEMSQVMHILRQQATKLIDLEGKDLLIFAGGTQVGKSTLINALNGKQFKENIEGTLDLIPDGESFAPMGTHENANLSCTEFPTLYHSTDTPYYFLDTRGFHDVRSDVVRETVSSLLFEIAMRNAKSVRLIFLSPCRVIEEGIPAFDQIGQILTKIVKDQDVTLYFLFNKYIPPRLQRDQFEGLDAQKQNGWVRSKLLEHCMRLVSTQTHEFENVCNRINRDLQATSKRYSSYTQHSHSSASCSSTSGLSASCSLASQSSSYSSYGRQDRKKQSHSDFHCRRLPQSSMVPNPLAYLPQEGYEVSNFVNQIIIPTDDETCTFHNESTSAFCKSHPDYIAASKGFHYAKLLENSFEKDLYGYVDVLQPQSLQQLKDTFRLIPPIQKEDLNINAASPRRSEFNQQFESILIARSIKMKRITYSFEYSRSIGSLLKTYSQKVTIRQNHLQQVKAGTISEALTNRYDSERAKEIASASEELNHLKNELDKLDSWIRSIENGREVVIASYPFKVHAGLLWWRDYRVRYPPPDMVNLVRYTRVEERLSKNTVVRKVYRQDPYHYDVEYTSGGTIRRFISATLGLIGAPFLSLASHKCKGEVILYTKPEYKHAQFLQDKRVDRDHHQKQIEITQSKLNLLKELSKKTVTSQIESLIESDNQKLAHLHQIANSIRDTLNDFYRQYPPSNEYFYCNYQQELDTYKVIAELLFDNSNPTVDFFFQDLHELMQAKDSYDRSTRENSSTGSLKVERVINQYHAYWGVNSH